MLPLPVNARRRIPLALAIFLFLGLAAIAARDRVRARRAAPAAPGPATPAAPTVAGAIGASFSVGQSGDAGYRIPLKVPPGTRVAPNLALAYSSQGGDGMLGMGWSLTGLARIERCPASILTDGFRGGIGYDADDRFCLDGSGASDPRLINLDASSTTYFTPGAVYHTEKESWSKVVASKDTCGGGPCSFEVWLKDGTRLGFGTQPDGQVAAVAADTTAAPPSGAIRTWLLNESTDPRGNTITITYTTAPPILGGGTVTSSGEAYPQRIDYTSRTAAAAMAPMRSVQFFYQPRPDATYLYQGGAQVQQSALLATVQTCIATAAGTSVTGQACGSTTAPLVSSFTLAYQPNAVTGRSRLASVTECDGGGTCFPPTTFTVTAGADGQVQTPIASTGLTSNAGSWVADFNGDGRTDLLSPQILASCPGSTGVLFFASTTGPGFTQPGTCLSVPLATADQVLPGDFNGDGRADLLLAGTSSYIYYYDASSGFPSSGTPVTVALGDQTQTADVNGDGLADVVSIETDQATVYLAQAGGLAAGVPTSLQLPGTVWLADVTGDSRADLLSLDETTATLYVTDTGGFDPPITIYDMPPSGDGAWIGDVTGDGLADLVTTDGTNAYAAASNSRGFQPYTTSSGLALSQGQTWATDFNGDGWIDLYSAGTTAGTLYLATAAGFTSIPTAGTGLSSASTWLGDFNGDGAADLYAPATTGDSIYFAGQDGAVLATDQAPDVVTAITDGLGGSVAITYKPLTDPTVYDPQAETWSGQLDTLTAFQGLAYTPLAAVQVPLYPTIELQNNRFVVATHVRQNAPAQNGVAYAYTHNYFYQQALVSLLGRGWLGFTTTTVTDEALGAQSTTWPQQQFPYDGQLGARADCAVTAPIAPCALPGGGASPLRLNTFAYRCEDVASGKPCVIPLTAYDPTATRLFQVLRTAQTDQDFTYGFTVELAYDYDRFGNPTRIADKGDVQNTAHPLYTCQSYANDTRRWRIGYLERRRLTRASDCRDLLTWHPDSDLRLGWLQYDAAMNVTAELHWDDQNHQWLGTAYEYDAIGNQVADAVMNGITPLAQPATRYVTDYEPVYRTFAIRRTTPSPDGKQAPLVTRFAYDARFGTRVAMASPSGSITNQCVDGFGRVTLAQGPPPTPGLAADANCLTAAAYPYVDAAFTSNRDLVSVEETAWLADAAKATVSRRVRTRNSWEKPTWLERTTILDGLGRTARAVTHDDRGGDIYVDREYLNETLTAQTSQPYFASAPPQWNTEAYDASGRKISATMPYQAPDGTAGVSQVTWSYSAPNTITETRVANVGDDYVVISSFEMFNRQQRTTQRVVPTDGNATSTFTYDALGALTGSVSPAGAGTYAVVNEGRFDSLGRRVRYRESNTGWMTESYDRLGFRQASADEAGQRVELRHDFLGRQTGRVMSRGGTEVGSTTFVWDQLDGAPVDPQWRGRIARAITRQGKQGVTYTIAYDPSGNPITREIAYAGVTGATPMRFTRAFDPQRREISRTYPDPDATMVTRTYAPRSGNLDALAVARGGVNPVIYADYRDFTAFGAPQIVAYDSGAHERWTFDLSDKPWSHTVYGEGGALLSSIVYSWDTLGNLLGTVDCAYAGNAGSASCKPIGVSGDGKVDLGVAFTYTSNRLTQAVGPYGADRASATLAYTYDGAGNLIAGGTTTYGYDGHQVISGTTGGATVFGALYDVTGNMCLRAAGAVPVSSCPAPGAAPAGTTAYAFDPLQRMTAAWNGAALAETYLHDDEDRRVLKAVMATGGALASTTLYPDPSYQLTLAPDGTVTDRQLFLPGQRERALLRDGRGATRVLHQDLTMDTVLTTGDTGKVGSRVVYTPYGTITSELPAGSAPRSALFQGAELDGTGLYAMGARQHDSTLGRFVSADRLAGDTFGQDALNRYAFTLNSPAVYVDPTGETPLLILQIAFQAIFDILTDGAAAPWSAEQITTDIIGAGVREATAVGQLQDLAGQAYAAAAGNGVQAGDLAWEAATQLRDAGQLGQRAKLTVAITDNAVYVDVSGAVTKGDSLRFGDLSQSSRTLLTQARGTAQLGSNGAATSLENWGIQNCSEFRVCNRIFLNRETLADVREMYTIDLRTWSEAPRCRNCVITSRDVPGVIDSDHPGTFVRQQNLPYRVRTVSATADDAAATGRGGGGGRGGPAPRNPGRYVRRYNPY